MRTLFAASQQGKRMKSMSRVLQKQRKLDFAWLYIELVCLVPEMVVLDLF